MKEDQSIKKAMAWLDLKMESVGLGRKNSFLYPKYPGIISITLILIGFGGYHTGLDKPYYHFLRIVCCASFAYFSYRSYKNQKQIAFWFFIVLAILFNPFIRIVFTNPYAPVLL